VAPDVRIVGVDPEGSILAGPGPIKTYKVEGIGYDFIPEVLDRSLVHEWIKSNDRDSFRVARQLIRQEGLLVGGSSGSAVWAAQKVCRRMKPGQRVVVILPDAVRNYMTKFVDDAWMRQHGFLQADWEMGTIGDLVRAMPRRPVITANVSERLGDAVERFKTHGISQMPVLEGVKLAGIITEYDVLHHLVSGRATRDSTVAEVMVRRVSTVSMHDSAGELPHIFERGEVAIVVAHDQSVVTIITKMDLIEFLSSRRGGSPRGEGNASAS
jgi:cystathionine beta-synthase